MFALETEAQETKPMSNERNKLKRKQNEKRQDKTWNDDEEDADMHIQC